MQCNMYKLYTQKWLLTEVSILVSIVHMYVHAHSATVYISRPNISATSPTNNEVTVWSDEPGSWDVVCMHINL